MKEDDTLSGRERELLSNSRVDSYSAGFSARVMNRIAQETSPENRVTTLDFDYFLSRFFKRLALVAAPLIVALFVVNGLDSSADESPLFALFGVTASYDEEPFESSLNELTESWTGDESVSGQP